MKTYLLKPSSEIFTKSERTKRRLIEYLKENIKDTLSDCDIEHRWFGLILRCKNDVSDKLTRIFGIEVFSEVEMFGFSSKEELLSKAYEFFKNKVKGKRFAVRCARAGRHDFSSKDVERDLGGMLYNLGKVDLTSPEITCYVELKNNLAFLYTRKIRSAGGFPIRSSGKALLLLSGGIDSAVAMWMAYRLGMDVDALFYDLGGDQVRYAYEVFSYLKEKWGYGSKGNFYYVDFRKVVLELTKVKPSYRNLALKYMFYKFARKVLEEGGYVCVITGESVNQVSTQTIRNLMVLENTTHLHVLRPLSALRKSEIVEYAKRIGTYDLSYKGKEYCAISPSKVETSASESKLLEQIGRIDPSVLESLKAEPYTYREKQETSKDVDVIINLTGRKLELEGYEVVDASFERILENMETLDRRKKYIVVCERGVKSSWVAEALRSKGFDAISMKLEELYQSLNL